MTRYVNPQHITDVKFTEGYFISIPDQDDDWEMNQKWMPQIGMTIWLVNGNKLKCKFKTNEDRLNLLSKIRNNVSHLVEI